MKLSEILRSFKEELKEKKLFEHHQTVEHPPKGQPRLVGNLYVYQFLTSKNNIKSSKFPFSINFTYPLRKTRLSTTVSNFPNLPRVLLKLRKQGQSPYDIFIRAYSRT